MKSRRQRVSWELYSLYKMAKFYGIQTQRRTLLRAPDMWRVWQWVPWLYCRGESSPASKKLSCHIFIFLYLNKSWTFTVPSAPAMTGSDFMQKFWLFVGQCTPAHSTQYSVLIIYPICVKRMCHENFRVRIFIIQ